MTSPRTRKPTPKRRRPTKKKKSTGRFSVGLSFSKILIFLALIVFFFISIGAAGYVIFFRVVVAAEPISDVDSTGATMLCTEVRNMRAIS